MFSKTGLILLLALLILWSGTGVASSRPGIQAEQMIRMTFPVHPLQISQQNRSTLLNISFSPKEPARDPGASFPDLCHHVETHGSPSLECQHRHSGLFSGTAPIDCLLRETAGFQAGLSSGPAITRSPDRRSSIDGHVLLPPPRLLSL
ncbi:MAG: hypothetical protein ACYCYP_01665 [Leptospirales bacterium]